MKSKIDRGCDRLKLPRAVAGSIMDGGKRSKRGSEVQLTSDNWQEAGEGGEAEPTGTWQKADAVSRFCGVEGSLSDRIEKSLMLCGVRERAAKMNLTQAILLLYHLIYDDESGSLNEVPPIMPAPGFVLLP